MEGGVTGKPGKSSNTAAMKLFFCWTFKQFHRLAYRSARLVIYFYYTKPVNLPVRQHLGLHVGLDEETRFRNEADVQCSRKMQ